MLNGGNLSLKDTEKKSNVKLLICPSNSNDLFALGFKKTSIRFSVGMKYFDAVFT